MRWIEEVESMTREEVLDARKYFITTTDLGWDFVPDWADGARVFDVNGKVFIDFIAGIGSLNTGHNHPQVLNSVRYALDKKLANLTSHQRKNNVVEKLAENLCKITPGSFDKKVFLARGGAEIASRAINLCLNRMKPDQTFFACYGAFHGRGGALRLHHSKELHRRKFIKELERSCPIEFPKLGHDCVWYKSAIVCPNARWRHQKPGAFFFECVQGEGGVNIGCFSCLPMLVSEFRKAGAIVVADEIQTGLMRTGKMFACEHYGVEPDVIILGKSLRPGDHLGAYVAKAELDYEEKGRDSLTGVSTKSCAEALGALEVLQDIDKVELEKKVNTLSTVVPDGLGFMRKIDFPTTEARDAVLSKCWKNDPVGLITLGAGASSLRIMPPVTIKNWELEMGLNVLKRVLKGQ